MVANDLLQHWLHSVGENTADDLVVAVLSLITREGSCLETVVDGPGDEGASVGPDLQEVSRVESSGALSFVG